MSKLWILGAISVAALFPGAAGSAAVVAPDASNEGEQIQIERTCKLVPSASGRYQVEFCSSSEPVGEGGDDRDDPDGRSLDPDQAEEYLDGIHSRPM